jgi:hypothetical protein
MIVALHGGFDEELLYGLGGGFLIVVLFFIFIHYRIYKSQYYNEEFVYFSSARKAALYLGFLLVNFFVAYIIFFVFTLTITCISGYIIKNF